jgi:hypothetical protein
MLAKIVEAGGQIKSYAVAARVLKALAEVEISNQQVRRLTHEIGAALAAERDRRVEDYLHHRRVEPACKCSPGRVLTRTRTPNRRGNS